MLDGLGIHQYPARTPHSELTPMDDTRRIHISVRQTLDWSDQASVEAHLIPDFRAKYDMWNRMFTMPYHVFRRRLTAIAERSLHAVDGATLSPIDEVPDGDIVIPVDDDDWFAPTLAAKIRAAGDAQTTGWLWRRTALEYRAPWKRMRRLIGRLVGSRPEFTCLTNNYAFRLERPRAAAMMNHALATPFFDDPAAPVAHIPELLGVQNRSLASQTSLAWRRPSIERAALIELFERHRALHASWRPTPGLEWAEPYAAAMAVLMREIAVK